MSAMPATLHLRGARAEAVVDCSSGAPVILHWGAPLGGGAEVAARDLAAISAALERPLTGGMLDAVAPVSVVPEHGSGFPGRPGLLGHRRRGTAWAPRFAPSSVEERPGGVVVVAVDDVAELGLTTEISLDEVLRVRCTLTNHGSSRYLLDQLSVTLPLPQHASELLTFQGRWLREAHGRRVRWDAGAVAVENRSGRTSHEHLPLVVAGAAGFGEWHGEVWAAHLAWSGNHSLLVERLPDGRRYVQLGELLHPGELALEPGATYSTPEVVATYAADGLTPATWGFHRSLRARPEHPRTPRPVLLNTWEAVYFDHDGDRLHRLATAAAELGVERFVLDDGWFGGRRDDRRGLGDWTVSEVAHPHGLGPLIAHVHALGMDFGIWVEPEMVNPDSDLYRAHPEWALVTEGYEPVLGRHQLVLDLARPDAYAHVRDQLHALLRDHAVAFVKWDMNRPLAQGSGEGGAAGAHAQTLAVYRLLDELRALHPGVEFETCASGGGRLDHEILRRTDRVWTSDVNDPLERQLVQRGTSMLIPPELMGAHVGPPRAHTTGRTHSLAFRAATAMFGHLGVEWDVLGLTADERLALQEAIGLHRRFRPLLHGGDVVRFDEVPAGAREPEAIAHGVYAPDRSEALVAWAQLRTGPSLAPPPFRLPGLAPEHRYRVEVLRIPGGGRRVPARRQPAWVADGIELTGRQLAVHGLQLPVLDPESVLLLHLATVAPPGA